MKTEAVEIRVKRPVKQLPFILRVIWFFVLGWELTGAWILIAWILNATIIGLPLGLWMINRVPQVLTLKAEAGDYEFDPATGKSRYVSAGQPAWPLRAAYFVLIGWWFSLLWAAAAWLLCVTIIGLPPGILMLHALPRVTTLRNS